MNWKEFTEIPGFPGYSVSRSGIVVSHKTGRELKVTVRPDDISLMPIVRLVGPDGKVKRPRVSTLVMRTFVGDTPSGHVIDYKDFLAALGASDRERSSLGNLEFVPRRADGESFHDSHGNRVFDDVTVEEIREKYRKYASRKAVGYLAKEYGVSKVTIYNIITGKTYQDTFDWDEYYDKNPYGTD